MGRAPSSGNCHTCRLRRVRCDRSRPHCDRCLKSNFECKGYEAVLRMQSHALIEGSKPGTSRLAKIQEVSSFPADRPTASAPVLGVAITRAKRHQKQHQQLRIIPQTPLPPPSPAPSVIQFKEEHPSPAPLPQTPRPKPQPRQQRPQHRRSSSTITTTTTTATTADTITPSSSPPTNNRTDAVSSPSTAVTTIFDTRASANPAPELSLSGFAEDMVFTYFFHCYGWINMHSIMLQDSKVGDTLAEGMGRDSLRALACGLFGKDLHVPGLQALGARLYGRTLHKLRDSITSPNKDELAALIKPIAIMGSYLISVENDLRFTHHRGLARILEYCGPEYFQSPTLLPIFDSCRLTMISNSIVRRTTTFLSQPEWHSVPWEKAPHLKTWTSKLLDLMTDIPNLISGVLSLMGNRIAWHSNNCPTALPEDPDVIPSMQRRVEIIKAGIDRWRAEWEAAHPEQAAALMRWAFGVAGNDEYRPGIQGFAGPDAYDYSVLLPHTPPPELRHDQETYTLLQDVSLYTTVLIWAARLTKYLAVASIHHTNVDFYNTPFSTTCTCCTSRLADVCDTIPDSHADVLHVKFVPDPEMQWNYHSARVAIAPIKVSPSDEKPLPVPEYPGNTSRSSSPPAAARLFHPTPDRHDWVGPDDANAFVMPVLPGGRSRQQLPALITTTPPHQPSTSALPTPPAPAGHIKTDQLLHTLPQQTPQRKQLQRSPTVLLPGDVRFAAQLRLLGWLTDRLPASRPQVLGALASIGLGHCGHDVRPVDGMPEVADAVRKTLDNTGLEDAHHILLRRYR